MVKASMRFWQWLVYKLFTIMTRCGSAGPDCRFANSVDHKLAPNLNATSAPPRLSHIPILTMRVTRSTSAVSRAIKRTSPAPVSHQEPRKRQRKSAPPSNSNKCNGTDAAAPLDPEAAERALHEAALIADASAEQEGVLLHPALTFKFQDAKMHLNSVDTRWGAMIDKLICSAFEGDQKEAFNPFRFGLDSEMPGS